MKIVQMKTAERRELHHSGIFIAKYELVSDFALIADFEQGNVCWAFMENASTFEGDIKYIMLNVVVFSV